MKSRKSSSILLWVIVLICCYQEIRAGVVVKQGKHKNSTNVATSTTKHPKVMHKAKTTTTSSSSSSTTTTTTSTTTTTPKPVVETVKPLDIDLDGRSAYINNQFVEEGETSLPDNSPPLYEILQQQMETVLSNTGNNMEIYADSPQMKEMPNDEDDKQKPPGKPLFSFDMNQFDEYDDDDDNGNEEEDATYNEEQPENCEDTEESLTENGDDVFGYVGQATQENYPHKEESNYGQTAQNPSNSIYDLLNSPQPLQNKPLNNPYDSSNYGPSTNSNQESSYNNYGQTNKPIQHAPVNSNQNSYGQSSPPDNQQTMQKPANKPAQSKPKPSSNQQPSPGNYGANKPQSQQSSQTTYGQTKPLDQQYNQKPSSPQNSYVKPKQQQQSAKPPHNSSKSPQNSQKPNNKILQNPSSPQYQYKPKPVQNNNNNNMAYGGSFLSSSISNPSYGSSTNTATPSSSANGNTNPYASSSAPEPSYANSNPATSSYSNPGYGHTNVATPSSPSRPTYDNSNNSSSNFTTSYPASLSPFSSTSGNMKFPNNDRKRHLAFRTVSSSTQFVATPLANLMFKFSIGMAKPSTLGNGIGNQAQIYSINDIEK